MKKINKNKGILFWITGLSGSGKTTISEEITKKISKKYGDTINISGDDLRKIFNLKKYDRKSRLEYALLYSKFCKLIVNEKINLIFSTISLFHKVRNWNKKNIDNYVEIFIKADLEKIIKLKKKKIYKKNKSIVGKNIKPEFPRSPHIIIENNFTKSSNKLSKELIRKILILR
tara:strand:- start:802 stop:1320 length:519 start_codon:yes stop_codon:yes gene_type:complete